MASDTFPWARVDAEVGVGLGEVGLEPDRLAVCGDGLGQLPLVVQGGAEVVVSFGVVGLEPDRLAERRLCTRVVVLPVPEDRAEAVVGLGVAGLEPDRRAGCVVCPLTSFMAKKGRRSAKVPSS
jgi:hypothetical protein